MQCAITVWQIVCDRCESATFDGSQGDVMPDGTTLANVSQFKAQAKKAGWKLGGADYCPACHH